MPPTEVLKLSGESSGVAIIVVVVLFLAFLLRGLALVKEIATGFTQEMAEQRTSNAAMQHETIITLNDVKSLVQVFINQRDEVRDTLAQSRREDAADRRDVRDRLKAADAERAEGLSRGGG